MTFVAREASPTRRLRQLQVLRVIGFYMPPRKRKRDQVFVDEVEPEINEINLALNEAQRAEKEQEIWDAIRETHYEGELWQTTC